MMLQRIGERRFAVRGRVAKTVHNLNVKKDDTVWLHFSDEGGGWYQWGHYPQSWPDGDRVMKCALAAPGPWYNMPDPATVELVPGTFYPALNAEFVPDESA